MREKELVMKSVILSAARSAGRLRSQRIMWGECSRLRPCSSCAGGIPFESGLCLLWQAFRGKRKVRKVGLKGNSSNVMLGVAQTLVWSSASYVVSGTLYMREATGAAAV